MLLRRIRHEVILRMMTPRERAMRELEHLLLRDLIEKDLFKDFYVELTMIVRRYIERAHKVRAPEQTTEEFLASASNHPAFGEEVLTRLRNFLEAADLVKFAAQHSDRSAPDNATLTAREYIQKDEAETTGEEPNVTSRKPNKPAE